MKSLITLVFLAAAFSAAAQEVPAFTLQWRALLFTYTDRKYDHVMDMFNKSFSSQTECLSAAHEGVAAIKGSIKKGESVVDACVEVPSFKPTPIT